MSMTNRPKETPTVLSGRSKGLALRRIVIGRRDSPMKLAKRFLVAVINKIADDTLIAPQIFERIADGNGVHRTGYERTPDCFARRKADVTHEFRPGPSRRLARPRFI